MNVLLLAADVFCQLKLQLQIVTCYTAIKLTFNNEQNIQGGPKKSKPVSGIIIKSY